MGNRSCDRFARFFSCTSMGTVLIAFLFICLPAILKAQEEPGFEEIDITLNVPRVGTTELPALILGQDVYLSIPDLFKFLKIKMTMDEKMDSLKGFVINPNNPFLIHKEKMLIAYKKQSFNIKPNDLIRTETSLYLRSTYFGEIFGLFLSFNFRALSVTLDTKIELPVFSEAKQAIMRNSINKLKGQIKADSVIAQSHPLFKPGMLDWNISSTQQSSQKEYRLGINTGVALAGGTAELGLVYQSSQPKNLDIQHYLWKYANNDHKELRQAMAGNINAGIISSVFKPVTGVQVTNTPTTFRRSFGSYKLSDVTQPNWTVELYINNILVDYTKADASGLFTFDVPLVYGNSNVSLRYYGIWGEEQERKMNISIPFNFLPKKELEYTLSV
ncbi:MAG: hypothetical protein PHS30_10715, partial [Bacteroidales bacterium]|nr:hypothetical protein [Bacteroidales bacterium]